MSYIIQNINHLWSNMFPWQESEKISTNPATNRRENITWCLRHYLTVKYLTQLRTAIKPTDSINHNVSHTVPTILKVPASISVTAQPPSRCTCGYNLKILADFPLELSRDIHKIFRKPNLWPRPWSKGNWDSNLSEIFSGSTYGMNLKIMVALFSATYLVILITNLDVYAEDTRSAFNG